MSDFSEEDNAEGVRKSKRRTRKPLKYNEELCMSSEEEDVKPRGQRRTRKPLKNKDKDDLSSESDEEDNFGKSSKPQISGGRGRRKKTHPTTAMHQNPDLRSKMRCKSKASPHNQKRSEVNVWEPPDYQNKKWFQGNCLKCQSCSAVYDTISKAYECFYSHGELRCYLCFNVIPNEENATDKLYEHYKLRHNYGNAGYKLACPYCRLKVEYDMVSVHVITVHFPEVEVSRSTTEKVNQATAYQRASSWSPIQREFLDNA